MGPLKMEPIVAYFL